MTAVRPRKQEPEERRGDAPRARAVALLEQLAEHRHERAGEGRVGDERADQVRDLERDRERVDRAPRRRSSSAATISRTSPRTREMPRRDARRSPRDRGGGETARPGRRASPRGEYTRHRRGRLLRSCRPLRGPFHAMANIKQQKKRVRIAARQRLENLRYRSTIKTLTKRLGEGCAGGRQDRRRRASRARRAGSTAPLRAAHCTATPPRARSRRRRGSSPASAPRLAWTARPRVTSTSARSSSRSPGGASRP